MSAWLEEDSLLWARFYGHTSSQPISHLVFNIITSASASLFEASCREHNEVSKAGSSQPFQSLIAVVVLASNSSHANTARSILGMAKYGQINVRANLTTPSRLYHITLLENDPKNVSFLLLQNNFTPHKWDIKNICPSLIG